MYCPSPEKSIYRGFTSDGMSKRFNYGGETTWLDKPYSWYLSWVWVLIAASFWSSFLKRPMPLFLFPVGGWVRDSMLPSHCQRLCHVSRHFPRTNQPTPPLPHPKLIHLVWPYLGPSPMKGAKFPGAQPSTKTFPGILQSSAPAKPPSHAPLPGGESIWTVIFFAKIDRQNSVLIEIAQYLFLFSCWQ